MVSLKIFKALSDITRLRCYRILASAPLCPTGKEKDQAPGNTTFQGLSVAELTDILQKPQYAVSRALAELRKAGLVQETRQGQLVLYRKTTEIPGIDELGHWLQNYCDCELDTPSVSHNTDGTTLPGGDPCMYDNERMVWRLDLRKKNSDILTYRHPTIGGRGLAGWEAASSGTRKSELYPHQLTSVQPIRVLFICVHNSARSQLAEEYLRKHGGNAFFADSAGIKTGELNPFVIEVLEEQGISIRNKTPKTVDRVYQDGKTYDWVIAVCDPAAEKDCPVFPGPVHRLSWPLPDPWKFPGSEKEKLTQTRELAQTIEHRVEEFIQSIKLNTAV